MLSKNKQYSTEQLFTDANVLQINQLYIKAVVRFMSKNRKQLLKISHNINRHAKSNNALIPNARLSKCQKDLFYSVPKIFNMLPSEFRDKPYHKIKKKLHNWLIKNRITWITT